MTSLLLSNASHSRCLPLSSVAFLLLRPPRAPPPAPPSPPTPPEPPDPPDFQICFANADSLTQHSSSSSISVFVSLVLHLSSAIYGSSSPARLLFVGLMLSDETGDLDARLCSTSPTTASVFDVHYHADSITLYPTESPQVCSYYSLYNSSKIGRVWRFVEVVALYLENLVLWSSDVAHSFSMGLDTFVSTLVPSCSTFLALMRSCTAVCGFCLDLSSFLSTPLLWLSDFQVLVQAPSIIPTATLPYAPLGSLDVVICYLTLAVNSGDWLGLVQPCVSSSDKYVAFPCALTAVGSSWAGFVMHYVWTRIQTDSLFNGQPWPSWTLLSVYKTPEGPRRSVGVLCVSFSDAAWLQSTICCVLGWSFKDPLNGKIHHGSFSRPFVSSALVAETLALKAAITAALALGVSRLACISDCQERVLLSNTGGHANELDGILSDFILFCYLVMSISVHFDLRSENCGADALAKACLLSCIPSSICGV
ncbi:Ribonuclease H domain [Arabidopsis thaliana x Arabidopsis arenosa]|uniref:Ribonuclease H domain n=1 Tax=Arabidopsis thaliana x Arabidopsis arenosa TaxID=1240361 RepID=A0A8T2C025_9BRAS|nr:Ribonuclease H domain [Arabidopsis thaliana x Arabidopsis arenosa]